VVLDRLMHRGLIVHRHGGQLWWAALYPRHSSALPPTRLQFKLEPAVAARQAKKRLAAAGRRRVIAPAGWIRGQGQL
jgi:hypothetical protein